MEMLALAPFKYEWLYIHLRDRAKSLRHRKDLPFLVPKEAYGIGGAGHSDLHDVIVKVATGVFVFS